VAVEGMSLTDGDNVLVADGAEALADAIAALYTDEAMWSRISANGLKFAENAWGTAAAWKILQGILSDLGFTVGAPRYPISLYREDDIRLEPTLVPPKLEPLASVQSRAELDEVLPGESLAELRSAEAALVETAAAESFTVDGFCIPCGRNVPFLVDMEGGGQRLEVGWRPNWRERLECPHCRMNNRQRLVAGLVQQALDDATRQVVYFMEQVTPIFEWASRTFPDRTIIGSEYLGYQYQSGDTVNGLRHEDVEHLSFADGSIDLIVSNDVLEHVPNPAQAIAECARVLSPAGLMLATIPFHQDRDTSVTRARLRDDGQVDHLLPPAYHGNPVSADGSLVFTDFGWDLLDLFRRAGFAQVAIEVFGSVELGHLGGGQLVFRCSK
ncbi:MAG: methyltransferase domain-containing protein, partial [Planctomycetes bacterium]|nr:methyltransferase domain-containing protein [Planctomycetota bacterium]